MADFRRSIKELWSVISENTSLKPSPLVEAELNKNANQLQNGVLYFSQKRARDSEPKLPKDFSPDFLTKLSSTLGVDKGTSYDLFCSYVVHEYRGTHETLKTTLSSERSMPALIYEVWNFYHMERLYSLLSIKHIMSNWQDSSHPYVDLFQQFLKNNTSGSIIKKVIAQFEHVTSLQAPDRDTHGPYMTNFLINQWISYNLQEQCELLRIALIYYKDVQPEIDDIQLFLSAFQRHSFGQRQQYRHLLSEVHEPILDLIGFFECLLLLETFDIEWLRRCHLGSRTVHQLLKDENKLKSLDTTIAYLGGLKPHGPLLLSWLLVRTWIFPELPSASLGRTALKLDVFQYLESALSNPIIIGSAIVYNTAHTLIYELLMLLLSSFEHHTLGPIGQLFKLAESLFQQSNLAKLFWENYGQDSEDGIGFLLLEAEKQFPLNLEPLLKLLASLAKAGVDSSHKVVSYFENFPTFTEHVNELNMSNIRTTSDGMNLTLLKSRHPYGMETVTILRGSSGQLVYKNGSATAVRWNTPINGWKVCFSEIAYPSDLSQAWLDKVRHVTHLVYNILKSDISLSKSLANITSMNFIIIERLISMAHPPVDILAECLNVVGILAENDPETVWSKLVQTGILPTLTNRPKDISQAAKCYLIRESIISQALASQERVTGHYPLCIAFLKLISTVAETFVEKVNEDFLACMVIVLQDIFPSFHKWLYVNISDRDEICFICLNIFHKLLVIKDNFGKDVVGSCELCVHSLLNEDSGQALLRIITSGEIIVNQAIEFEGSEYSNKLLLTVKYALSLLNRLLIFGPKVPGHTRMEKCLLVSPAQSKSECVILSIAHYIFLRFDPRLCTLALHILKRFAKLYPMSLLACIGADAEGFRDQILLRLSKLTEDVQLKVAILQLLSACIISQPGVAQLFLAAGSTKASSKKSTFLEQVIKILDIRKEGNYFCPPELHSAALEVIQSIWASHQLRAMDFFRDRKNVWDLICFPLLGTNIRSQEKCLSAYIIQILALEIFYSKSKLDAEVTQLFQKIQKDRLLQDWSSLVHSNLMHLPHQMSSQSILNISQANIPGGDIFALLNAWKEFCITVAKSKYISLTLKEKTCILSDIMNSIKSEEVLENRKISVLLGELYLVLLNQWGSDCICSGEEWCDSIGDLLTKVASGITSYHPKFVLVVAGIATSSVKALKEKSGDPDFKIPPLNSWVRSVIIILKYTSQNALDNIKSENQLSLNVCTVVVFLLKEVISLLHAEKAWLELMHSNCVISVLTQVLHVSIQAQVYYRLAHGICQLFISLASRKEMAELIHSSNTIGQTSQLLVSCYTNNHKGWLEVYRLIIMLVTSLLHTLRHFFLNDALAFIIVHVDRMYSSLIQVRTNPNPVNEAIMTAHLVYKMSVCKEMWACHHAVSVEMLMKGVCDATASSIAYLWRPVLLSHIVNKGSSLKSLSEECSQTFHHLSGIVSTPQLTEAKSKLFELLAVCLACCQEFSPDVCQALSNQDTDIARRQLMVNISFASPSLDQSNALTFGTLLAAVHLCLKSLMKLERGASPVRSPSGETPLHSDRTVILAVLEISLSLCLSQAVLCHIQPDLPLREKQLLSRELNAEVGSVKLHMQRHLRRGTPVSPEGSRRSRTPSVSSEWVLVQMFIDLVEKIFK